MDAIKLLKTIHSATSEELFDIIKQPDQQCPVVDMALRDLKAMNDECEYQQRRVKGEESVDEVKDALNDLCWAVQNRTDINDHLESLRTACSQIRDWGAEWKHFALLLLKKHGHEEYLADRYSVIESEPLTPQTIKQ